MKSISKTMTKVNKTKAPFHKKESFGGTDGIEAGGGGFEPPHTDPESAVLPLDEPPKTGCAKFYHHNQ